MKRSTLLIALTVALALAQRRPSADWLTFGGDPQRSGWAHNETILNKENVKGLKLAWSLKLDNVPLELNSLTVPVVDEKVITPHGFKDLVIVGGSSDNLYAIDADTGKLVWKKTFEMQGPPPKASGGHWLCPNALETTPVIDKRSHTVYIISRSGELHALNVVNGEDRFPPAKFLPPYAKDWSLNLADGVIYTATSQHCNGIDDGVWAMDLNDPNHAVKHWKSVGGIWGRAGVAIGFDGKIYAELGDGAFDVAANKFSDAVVALTPKTLELSDYYVPENQRWIDRKDLDMGNISPVVFKFKQWELVAGSGKEGVIYLLDTKSLGGADHRTPLFRSPLYTNEDVDFAGRGFWGAFATWEDEKGERWLYAPAGGPEHSTAPAFPITHGKAQDGSIMAFKVEVKDSKPVLTPAWMSTNMSVPDPPLVANGVVFVLSTGENTRQVVPSGDRLLTSAERAQAPSGNATLYALDSATGQTLYSSEKAIPGFAHFGGLAISEGRIYLVTYDSTVYSFSLGE
ncbi:MAG TPA: PQQ-binding-like beta-propeller repeat protein [Bryobacteraceae bacterium]|nr:PQQ-binding-like beta-propeller repeat protein [Bryobacteraceae bacterium]